MPVVEPDDDQVEMFVSGSPASSESVLRAASAPVNNEALDAEYEQAMSALRTGNVELGVAKLQAFAEQNPRHPRADNALYFSGLGQIGLKDFIAAPPSSSSASSRPIPPGMPCWTACSGSPSAG